MENQPTERAIAGARAFAECNSTTGGGRGEVSTGQSGTRRNAARQGRRGRKFQEGKRGTRVYVCVCVKREKKGRGRNDGEGDEGRYGRG